MRTVDTVLFDKTGTLTTKMLQNLGWATGYNLLAVPLAAGVLAGAGVTWPRPWERS
jgi:cation transport ATPase